MEKSFEDITIRNIWEARKRIATIINKTPLIKSTILSEITGNTVYLKLENVHEIGAFKVRGAANKILSLTSKQQERGVTTFSTGNHGMAVAYVANQLGIKSVVCISRRVPRVKVDNLKRLGAQVEIIGDSQDEAAERCYELQKTLGLTLIKPFDDPDVIAGQGTIGLEIIEENPEVDTVVVPLSGGGLLAGVSLALKSMDSSIQVAGVSMEHGAVMYESLKVNKPVLLKEVETLADSLLGGIGLNNRYTFNMVKKYMDDVVLVTEEEIAEGLIFMLDKHRMVVEGAAATGVSTVLKQKLKKTGKNIVVIISGCNVDLSVVTDISENYISKIKS